MKSLIGKFLVVRDGENCSKIVKIVDISQNEKVLSKIQCNIKEGEIKYVVEPSIMNGAYFIHEIGSDDMFFDRIEDIFSVANGSGV